MSFLASNVVPADAYQTVKRAAVQLKVNLQSFNSAMIAGDVSYDFIVGVYSTLVRAKNQFNTLKNTTGLADYAKDQESDQAYDVVSEFNTMLTKIDAALDWLEANIPTSITANEPADWLAGDIISNMFTSAQTGGLRTQLNAVTGTIS